MRADTGLEQDFIVVTWDQRGAGKSYPALDPVDTLTLDQMVADTIEVTHYLGDRFGEDRIFLVGNSWGSTLGVLAVQQHPELFHALIGTGQMVSQRETDVMFWEDTLAWAERTGRTDLAETLRRNGPPPYADVRHYEYATSHEHDWNPYPEFDPANEMPAILFVPEYTWMERINGFRGFLDSAAVLYPQLQDIDFRVDAPGLDVPFYMVVGEHEARGRAVLADEWFDLIEAPHKERIVFDGAGHRPHFDQPARFAELMRGVLAGTRQVLADQPETGDTMTNLTTRSPTQSVDVDSRSEWSAHPTSAARTHALEVNHVTKRYGRTTVVDDLIVHCPSGPGHRVPRTKRCREVDHDEDPPRPGVGRPGQHHDRRPPLPELPDPAQTVGVLIETNAFHPGRSGRNHLRILADASRHPVGPSRGHAGTRRPRWGCRPTCRCLLAWDAATSRPRRRPPQRSACAGTRRARQRTRPTRHPRVARPAAFPNRQR